MPGPVTIIPSLICHGCQPQPTRDLQTRYKSAQLEVRLGVGGQGSGLNRFRIYDLGVRVHRNLCWPHERTHCTRPSAAPRRSLEISRQPTARARAPRPAARRHLLGPELGLRYRRQTAGHEILHTPERHAASPFAGSCLGMSLRARPRGWLGPQERPAGRCRGCDAAVAGARPHGDGRLMGRCGWGWACEKGLPLSDHSLEWGGCRPLSGGAGP